MGRYGLSQLQFSEITDDLDNIEEEIIREFPSCGEGMLRHILADRGKKVHRIVLHSF